ncbi:MAG TPA: hypothetical protein VGN97_13770 [Mesorhizobium sp.]|nr:hypothetical protein [Mesorhizobium sp.]
MPVTAPGRWGGRFGFGLRARKRGNVTIRPRAAMMTSRRAAASAGRSRRSTAR